MVTNLENTSVVNHTGPAFSLIEVIMHELANPVQAARTTLRLWQSESSLRPADPQNRVQGLDSAFEHIATVIQCVQAVKESAFLPPAYVSSDKLRADILAECSSFEIRAQVLEWPATPVQLRMHGGAIPLMLLSWAAISNASTHGLKIALRHSEGQWRLHAKLRDGEKDSISRIGSATAVAGFAGAISEFMIAAGGAATVREDDLGVYEIELSFEDDCELE